MESVRRRDRVYGAHLLLAALLVVGRMTASTQGIASWSGGSFASSPIGRLAALLGVLLGVAALAVVVAGTIAERRDKRVLVLIVLLASALALRARFDVFDFVYVAAVPVLALLWYRRGRPVIGSRS